MPNFGTCPNQTVIQYGSAICHRLVVIHSLLDCQLSVVYYNVRMKRHRFGRISSKGDSNIVLLRLEADRRGNPSGWSYMRSDDEKYVFLGNRQFEDMFDILYEFEEDIIEHLLYETH